MIEHRSARSRFVRFVVTTLLCVTLGLGVACVTEIPPSDRRPPPPNVLLILADDLGPTDLGVFGSEIPTPNLDRLAARGTIIADFTVAPACSPTRAMLLTGREAHDVGLGTMAGEARPPQIGRRGYEGRLSRDAVTLAQRLRTAGYATSVAGKCHLGGGDHGPHVFGFERSFVLVPGGASHFDDAAPIVESERPATYLEDGRPVRLDPGFFSTDAYTDRAIEDMEAATQAGRPFFAYVAYTAPHWPLQETEAWIDRFAGLYDDGWDALRSRRWSAARSSGLTVGGAPPERLAFVRPWGELSPEDRRRAARAMEVYAAMVAHLDAAVGRLSQALRRLGVEDDTMIVFLSDNGPEGNPIEHLAGRAWMSRFDDRLEAMGRRGSYVYLGPGWAQATAAPFRLFKAFPTEGGTRAPVIVTWPGHVARGRWAAQPATVLDLAPTILDAAGVADGVDLPGRSLLPALAPRPMAARDDEPLIGFELFGRRSYRRGRWKILWLDPPYGPGRWQLFDVVADPGETSDLARVRPELAADLIECWDAWAAVHGVVLPERQQGYADEPPPR